MAERLQKYLARAGIASRRHAEEMIAQGRIAVNGRTVRELGSKVDGASDRVTVDGRAVEAPAVFHYFLLYKPHGVVTTLKDPQGRPTVAQFTAPLPGRMFPVGRLDYDAEGALLLTDDGDLAHRLTHPKFEVPRTYLAKVKGVPSAESLEKLKAGVPLLDGVARPLAVEEFERAEKNTWLTITVAEGRTHLIKRMCSAIGHPVARLFRPSHGGVALGKMQPGEVRALSPEEVEQVKAVSRGEKGPTIELRLPPRRAP